MGAGVDRETAGDDGAAAFLRDEFDRAAMQFDEGTHDREAEPDAAVTAAAVRFEAIEHAVDHRLGNAAAAILDPKHDVLALSQGREGHRAAGLREADCIRQQVEQDLAQALVVPTPILLLPSNISNWKC